MVDQPTPEVGKQPGNARDELTAVSRAHGGGESLVTVIIALVANGAIAIAKTVAAVLTGSASMVAESAHSYADTGNEIFLLIAEKRGKRPPDENHPRGHGREAYVWAMFAAVGLFVAGAVLSIWHGVTALFADHHEGTDYLINWIVLAVAFVFEGISFAQATRQAHRLGRTFGLRPIAFALRTSDPILRAVFFEDLAALLGLLLAAAGVGLHELTGNAVWDALGSIAVGLLLGCVALILLVRNHDFLVGETVPKELWDEVLLRLLEHDEVEKVTYLHLEYVGPMSFFLVAAVDLVGDERETELALRLRHLERDLEEHEPVTDAVLTLSTRDEEGLRLPDGFGQVSQR
ncbi:MAG TPA: cation diffusion facilitator family transporter [Marmoricola sp.]|nr:cation diffusion facilitator family transporter [Marmoricola sp.]